MCKTTVVSALVLTSTFCAAAALCGCSGSSPADAPGVSDAGSDVSAFDSASDTLSESAADAGGDAKADTAEASAPITDRPIIVSTYKAADDSVTNITVMATAAKPGERCYMSKAGSCFYYDCRTDAPTPPEPAWISAGAVTLKKGSEVLLVATPNSDGSYPLTALTKGLWQAGDALRFEVEGATIPSFDHEFSAPPVLTLLSPTPPDGGELTISKDEPLTLTWTPVASGVTVTMSQTGGNTGFSQQGRFLCEFDGNLGTGTVPVEAFSVIRPSSTWNGNTALNVGANATKDLSPGGYNVHVHAINAVLNWVQVVTAK